MKRLAKDTVTRFGQSKPPIYLGQAGRESLPARPPHRAGTGLASGDRVNLPERYDYPGQHNGTYDAVKVHAKARICFGHRMNTECAGGTDPVRIQSER